ncbi:sulfite exporter TauE/SafE family protein [Frigidibacter sp. SD6-1]|uniref:sulfite exporter TauE/SafE family protein n=1 Tax=Frigidibacter sp. SD6-1 TaxID=3032581 RepID=UPI0024E02DAE|nr:sulfite exporter TauE/SafE family protein [Frigidibacter sp. SD6-1]
MPADPLFWMLATLAAILVGMGKGGLPIVGMLAVPVMALAIPPVTATALLAPVFVVSDMFGLYSYRHQFDRRVVMIMAVGATLGVVLGWLTAARVPDWAVTGAVGVIGLSFALRLILARRVAEARRADAPRGVFWGAVTGFTSFVAHAGAPPFQVYVLPLRLPKALFAGTNTVFFTYLNLIKLIPYWALGQFNPGNLKVAAVLAIPAALAVFAGVRLVRIVPDVIFFRLVTAALALISVKLIFDGLGGAFR